MGWKGRVGRRGALGVGEGRGGLVGGRNGEGARGKGGRGTGWTKGDLHVKGKGVRGTGCTEEGKDRQYSAPRSRRNHPAQTQITSLD